MELAGWTTAIVTILLAVCASLAGSLANVRVVLPLIVRAGSSATLLCLFDLEGAPLYSVKWYRGRREFYRYLPEELPSSKVFSYPGINVDLSSSGARQVTLVEVPSYLSGEFSCEVSADAPSFSTACVAANLVVVDFVGGRPLVTVDEPYLSDDQPLIANCTATAPRLDFYINNILVNASYVTDWPGGATLNITLVRTFTYLPRTKLRVKCVAFIGEALTVSSASVAVWLGPEPDNYVFSGSLSSRIFHVKQELVVLASVLNSLEASIQKMDKWEESGPFRDEITAQYNRQTRAKQIFSCYEMKHKSPFRDLNNIPFQTSTDVCPHGYNNSKKNDDMTLLEEIIQLGLNESSIPPLHEVYYSQYHANMVEINPDSIRKSFKASQSEKETQTDVSTRVDCGCGVNNSVAGSSDQYDVCTTVYASHDNDENKCMNALDCGIGDDIVERESETFTISEEISSKSLYEVSDVCNTICEKRESINLDTNSSQIETQESRIWAVFNTVESNSGRMKDKTDNVSGRLEATNGANLKFLDNSRFSDNIVLEEIQLHSLANAEPGLGFVEEKNGKYEKKLAKRKESWCFCRKRRTVKDTEKNNLDTDHCFGSMKSENDDTHSIVCNAVASNTGSGMKGKREWTGLSDAKMSQNSEKKKSRGIFGIKGKGYRERKLLRKLKAEKKESEKEGGSRKKKSGALKKCIRCLFCGLTTNSLGLRGKGYRARKRRRKEAISLKKKTVKTDMKNDKKPCKSSSKESRSSKNEKSNEKNQKSKKSEEKKSLENETSRSEKSTKIVRVKEDKKLPSEKISRECSNSKHQEYKNNNSIVVKGNEQTGCGDNCYGVCCNCKTSGRKCTNDSSVNLKNKQLEKVDCATNTDLVTFNNERFPRTEEEVVGKKSKKCLRNTKEKAIITTTSRIENKIDENNPKETESESTIVHATSEEKSKMDVVSTIDDENDVLNRNTPTQHQTQVSKSRDEKFDEENKHTVDRPIMSSAVRKEVNRSKAKHNRTDCTTKDCRDCKTVPMRKEISQLKKTESPQNRYVTWEVIKERYNIDDKRGRVIRKSNKGNFKEGFKRRMPVKKRSVQFEDFEESENASRRQNEDDSKECIDTEEENGYDERKTDNEDERIIKISNLEEFTDNNGTESIQKKKCGRNKYQVNYVHTDDENSSFRGYEPFDKGDAPAIIETSPKYSKQKPPQKPYKTWGIIRAIYNIDERKADTLKHSSDSTFREIRRKRVSIKRNSLSFPIGKNVLKKDIENDIYTDIHNLNRVKHRNSTGETCFVKRVDIKDKDMLIHTYETLGRSDGSDKVERIIHVLPMYEPRETITLQREEDNPVSLTTGKHVHFPRNVEQVGVSQDKTASWDVFSLIRACFCCCCM